jgi:uncharacterized protein YbaR (Trm112 family)
MPALSPELLAILACPVPECRGPLELRGTRLVCVRCGLRYPVEERWPVLIPDKAELPEKSEQRHDEVQPN